jgi:predicted PurR-regulated permease PerM
MTDVWKQRVRVGMVILPILLGLYVLWTVRTAILPFVLGTAIAYVIAPAVSWLAVRLPFYSAKPYMARGIAILVLYATVAAIGVGLGFLLVPDAIDEINEFSDNLPDTIDSARERLQEWYDEYIPNEHHDTVDGWLEDAGNAAGDWAVGLAPRAAGFIGSTFAILIGYLTIPVWLFYTLKDHPRGVRSFIGMFPPDWRHDVRNVIGIIDAVFKNYIRAMLLQGLIIGAMSYVVLELLDVNYPIGLAVIAGVTEMIPIIGPIIGAIPAVLVALAQDPVKAIWVALAFLAIQQIENNLIVPKIQGDFLRLHPGVIIVLLVLAGALGGFIFVLLVVPLAAMVRDLYQYAYLRLGDVEQDAALDRAIGEYGAKALRERLVLEQVVPVADLGNPGFGREPTPPPPPDAEPQAGDVDEDEQAAAEVTTEGDDEPPAPRRRLRFVPGRK